MKMKGTIDKKNVQRNIMSEVSSHLRKSSASNPSVKRISEDSPEGHKGSFKSTGKFGQL